MGFKNLAAFCIWVNVLVPTVGLADDWGQYQEIMDRYYHLDKQDFRQITCHVDLDILSDLVARLRQQFANMPGLKLTDTLDDYTIHYDRDSGPKLNDPTLSITILSEQGMKDPERVKLGISQVENGFTHQVNGTDQQIQGLFSDYRSPDSKDIKIQKIEGRGDDLEIEAQQSGREDTMAIHGAAVHESTVASGISITTDSSYTKINGDKLILDKATMTMKQPVQTTSINYAFTYQTLGSIAFPNTINEHIVASAAPGTQTSIVANVRFTNCQVKY